MRGGRWLAGYGRRPGLSAIGRSDAVGFPCYQVVACFGELGVHEEEFVEGDGVRVGERLAGGSGGCGDVVIGWCTGAGDDVSEKSGF